MEGEIRGDGPLLPLLLPLSRPRPLHAVSWNPNCITKRQNKQGPEAVSSGVP